MLERRAEEVSLTKRPDTGNNNDHSRMQRLLSMENKKVGTIVRYRCVILGADEGFRHSSISQVGFNYGSRDYSKEIMVSRFQAGPGRSEGARLSGSTSLNHEGKIQMVSGFSTGRGRRKRSVWRRLRSRGQDNSLTFSSVSSNRFSVNGLIVIETYSPSAGGCSFCVGARHSSAMASRWQSVQLPSLSSYHFPSADFIPEPETNAPTYG